jgi:hypothetical protein
MVTQSSSATAITVIFAPACHFCEDAREALTEIAAGYPLTVTYVEADSARGRQLIAVHRPAMFPLILVSGNYFSVGRIPRKKLRKYLDRNAAAVA